MKWTQGEELGEESGRLLYNDAFKSAFHESARF